MSWSPHTVTTNFHYEIFNPACPPRCLLSGLMRRGAATANNPASQSVELRCHAAPRIPTAAATLQPQWPGAANGYPAAAGSIFTSAHRSAADEGGEGRLSVRNPGPRQTAPGGEPVFAWQIYRCGRIPSRDRSEGPLHR